MQRLFVATFAGAALALGASPSCIPAQGQVAPSSRAIQRTRRPSPRTSTLSASSATASVRVSRTPFLRRLHRARGSRPESFIAGEGARSAIMRPPLVPGTP